MESTNPGSLDQLKELECHGYARAGDGLLQGLSWEIGPCGEIRPALVFFSLAQQWGGTDVLSAALLQLGSECDPKQVPGLWASGAPGPQPGFPAGLCTSLSSGISAIDSSPAGCLYLPSDTSPKNLPGSWAAHGTRHGHTGPCGCLPSHRGLQLQGEPVSTHRLTASSCFRTGWGLSAAEGREELQKQGGAGGKGAPLLLGEALGSSRHSRILKSCGMETVLGRWR